MSPWTLAVLFISMRSLAVMLPVMLPEMLMDSAETLPLTTAVLPSSAAPVQVRSPLSLPSN